MGYEASRRLVFDRQKQMGVITDQAELSPINPYGTATSADGKGWPELSLVPSSRDAAVLRPGRGGARRADHPGGLPT